MSGPDGLLLDTHIWIWALIAPDKLAAPVARALRDPANEIWLSPISMWEFLTLVRKGRIIVADDPYAWLDAALQAAPVKQAPLTDEIVVVSQKLQLDYWDPADRFIGATARHLDLTLVTADRRLIGAAQTRILANN